MALGRTVVGVLTGVSFFGVVGGVWGLAPDDSEGQVVRVQSGATRTATTTRTPSGDARNLISRSGTEHERERSTTTRVGRMMTLEAHQRVAVVTGASSGIGEATAETLAALGFHVVAVA